MSWKLNSAGLLKEDDERAHGLRLERKFVCLFVSCEVTYASRKSHPFLVGRKNVSSVRPKTRTVSR